MKQIVTLFLILFFNCIQLSAGIPTTQKMRINDRWKFIRQDMANVWEVMRPIKAGQPESVPLWLNVTLPHCFNSEDAVDPDLNYYQGVGWYKTSLSIDNPYKTGRVLLEFEGAGQKTDVYIYNTKVGNHVGGYDGWVVDITEAIDSFRQTDLYQTQFDGKIPIAVRCDNSRDTERIPSSMSDFTIYGGLYRYVNLIYTPPISLNNIKIIPQVDEKGKKGSVSISVSLYNPQPLTQISDNVLLNIQVKDPSGKDIYHHEINNSLTKNKNIDTAKLFPLNISDNNFNVTDDLKAILPPKLVDEIQPLSFNIPKPLLWDIDTPNLYTCTITLTVNGQTMKAIERFGFRNYEFKDKGPFYLNGKRLLLRGTHRHEDHAGVGAAMTEEMMIKEMKMIKEMGANFIRLGHYQQSDIILNLCDELGLLVWEEIPWCRGGLGGESYKAQARRMLTNMIEQHHNHPSVILWGLGNENDWPGDFPTFNKDSIRNFMTELHNLAHELDEQRKTCIRRCDFCKDVVDVYSPTIWAGWYSKAYTDYKAMANEGMQSVNHFFHAEWGGDSHAGRHAESDLADISNAAKNGDWSESYIIRLFDWHLKEQETMPWLTGSAFWTFKDFATPLRPDNPIPYVNQKGVVQRDFTPKESYYVFQSYWSKKPMVHIYGHTWPIRWGKPNEAKEILVYSNCHEVELIVNGVSHGKKKRNSQNFPAAGLRWYIPLCEGANLIEAKSESKEGTITDSITQEYQTAVWGDEAKLEMNYTFIKKNIALIEVQIKDKNGIRCLDSKKEIEFQLAGNGSLIQNQGTTTGSRKIQFSNGRAYIKAIIKGECNVYAETKDIRGHFIHIVSQ